MDLRQLHVPVLDFEDMLGPQDFQRRRLLLLRQVRLADHFQVLAIRHRAAGLDVAGERQALRTVLYAGDVERLGKDADVTGVENASANPRVGLEHVIGLVSQEGQELVDALT